MNSRTGLFYVVGEGFTEECHHKATQLTDIQFAMVRYQFDNVVEFLSTNGGRSPEWPCCECEDCIAAGDWEGVAA